MKSEDLQDVSFSSTQRPLVPRLTVPNSLSNNNEDHQSNESPTALSVPRTRGRSRTFSQVASPFKSNNAVGEGLLFSENKHGASKALEESRKLLSHILNELANRPRAPSVWSEFKNGSQDRKRGGSTIPSGFARHGSGDKSFKPKEMAMRTFSLPDSEDEDELLFSPDVAYDLLSKLRDILLIAQTHNWHIFDDRTGKEGNDLTPSHSGQNSSFRFRRSSFQRNARRSRSFSPGQRKGASPELLSQCLSMISSIINEDCKFQLQSRRLSRPPNALQALTLDIVQVLAHLHMGTAKVLYEIGMNLIAAFSTFPVSMHGRLLNFFENVLMRPVLESLELVQRGHNNINRISDDLSMDEPGIEASVAIQVDEALDDSFASDHSSRGWLRWSPSSTATDGNSISTNAPAQPLDIYYLSSLSIPLLAAILENIDLETPVLELSSRVYRLIRLITSCKLDAPLDVLDIIAYSTRKSRYRAISLMQTLWPRALGHTSTSKPFPILTYTHHLHHSSQRKRNRLSSFHSHQFVPWRFQPPASSVVFEGSALHDCHTCRKQISGFGLLCAFCMCAVHPSCYDSPEGSYLAEFSVRNEQNTQKVALFRYSFIIPRTLDCSLDILEVGPHVFEQVNIFTLSLCSICHLPLWGYLLQGYRCGTCNRFAHESCLRGESAGQLPNCSVRSDTSAITIDWSVLRSSFAEYYHDILFREEDIMKHTHEELSIYWSILWIQLELLKHGVASGSVIINQIRPTTVSGKGGGVDDFELQYLSKMYEAYLASGRLSVSPMFGDWLQHNQLSGQFQNMIFDWASLAFITSIIKSPASSPDSGNDFLNVSILDPESTLVDASHPFEVTSIAHVRDILGEEFGLIHDQAACIMLFHLHQLGFMDCPQLPKGFFRSCNKPDEMACFFRLPLGLDLSSNVESLIIATEACLKDLDVSVNEAGFLLLTQRLWPNGMMSDYALTRLMRALLNWILSEDDKLVVIMREYVARRKDMPGVPSAAESARWPNSIPSRSLSSGSNNNGNDYVACRQALLQKYASRWLFALHCIDHVLYGTMLFKVISDLAKDDASVDDTDHATDSPLAEMESVWTDRVLKFILKICHVSLAFSAADDLLINWLAALPDSITHQHKSLSTLARLFNRDPEGSGRWSVAHDATVVSFDQIGATVMDPWRAVINVASENYDGLKKSLGWITLFASSGVDIPVTTFLQLSAMLRDFKASFEDHTALAEAALAATWLKSMGRQDLQRMIADFHDRNVAHIIENVTADGEQKVYHFVRVTLATCLLLYGVNRGYLREIGLVEEHDIKNLPSRRKVTRRASFTSEGTLRIEIDFVDSLVRYVEEGPSNLRCLIAKFINTLLTEASHHLGQQEIERFIISNGYFLTRCAWKFYDMHNTEIHPFRTSLLLRILVVDAQPFDELLIDNLSSDVGWEIRLAAASQLYQVILDVTKPGFYVENYQWRSNVLPVFYHFFSCLWSNYQEEIRSATDSWVQALQPAHLESISLCFSESLSRAPVKERLKLASFALRLRGHFPHWKVISWDSIIETLMDDDFLQRDNEEAASAHLSMYGISSTVDGRASRVIDPDVKELQCSLVLLSLQMIADGITIDLFSFLKIKYHMVVLLGFEGTGLVPAPSGHTFHVQFGEISDVNEYSLPCIQGLMALMDAYRPFEISPSAITGAEDDTPSKLLVGSLVVDVVISLFNKVQDLTKLPALHLKTLFRSIIIIIYKHDFESAPLRHLREPLRRAVRRTSDMLISDLSYELRQLVLSVVQSYMKKWPLQAHTVLIHHTHNVMKLLAKLHVANDDILASQALTFLDEGLAQYWSNGLFYQLSKTQDLPDGYFTVLRHMLARNARKYSADGISIRDDILRDTITQLVAHPGDPGQRFVIENLSSYIEKVHHQGLSQELLAYFGRYMAAILRNAGEATAEAFNPNPLLSAAATLIQHNKSQVRDLLPYIETTLRLAILRFDVTVHALARLLHVTSALYRRTEVIASERAVQMNIVANVICEVLSEALRGKNRVTPTTITAIAESLISPSASGHEIGVVPNDVLSRLAIDAFYYLHNSVPSEFHTQKDLSANLAAAGLILQTLSDDVGFLSRQLNDYAYERHGRHALSVRDWSIITLRAIQNSSPRAATHFFSHLSRFSYVYHLSLRMHTHTHSMGLPRDLEASDISYAFTAIKLWLLLSRRCSTEGPVSQLQEIHEERSSQDRNAYQVWNELWPPFENLITMSEIDQDDTETLPIASLIWSSVVDIFLFLRQIHSTISLDSSAHITTLNRVKALGRGEAFTNKLVRTVNSMSEPAHELAVDVMIVQFQKELVATDKVHALELKREIGRMGPAEKGRKETRIPTG